MSSRLDRSASASHQVSREEFLDVIAQLQSLSLRVEALEAGAEWGIVQSEPRATGTVASPPTSTGSALDPARLQAAREIGQWILRCLAGKHRGLSGREKIPQASRLYLVVRDFEGTVHTPPLVFNSWRETSDRVSPHGQAGDSIFVGVPTKEEARLALSEARLEIPSALRRN